MKNLLFIWCLFGLLNSVAAQNLVLNPSFETKLQNVVDSPSYLCQFWDQPMYYEDVSHSTSSDYFHADYNAGGDGTPCNWLFARIGINDCIGDIQYPYSGVAYIGCFWSEKTGQISNIEDREMIQGRLIQPLQIGHKYKAWYYVNSIVGYSRGYCNNFCMGFSVNHVAQKIDISTTQVPIFYLIPRNISIKMCDTSIVTDSINWVYVGGTEFIADSAYNYIIVGNLKKMNETKFLSQVYNNDSSAGPYYIIDEVHVEEVLDISQINLAEYLPTAFSPNQDGHNDYFSFLRPIENANATMQISIFNRWGNRVFTSNTPTFAWDGTYLGAAQPSGTYVWQVTFINNNSTQLPKTQKGNITLIK